MISSDPEPAEQKSNGQDDLKIAFRYKNLPTTEISQQHQFGHYYDLSKTMSEEQLKTADIDYWTGKNDVNGESISQTSARGKLSNHCFCTL